MRLFLFCLATSLVTFTLNAQFKVYDISLDSIKYFVENDPLEHQQCAVRFFNGDTTLYGLGILSVYYGDAFTDDYSPYGEKPLTNEVARLHEEGKADEAIELALEILDKSPGFLEMYYELGDAYLAKGDSLKSQQCRDLFFTLASIPYYSGTGESMDSAFVVRSVRDEYILLNLMGYGRPTGQSLVTDEKTGIPYDVMEATGEDGEEKEIYFNIYQPYSLGLAKMFSDVEEETEAPEEKDQKKKRKKKKKRSKHKD